MLAEQKKLHLIEKILKIDNELILDEVDSVIEVRMHGNSTRRSFKDFAGMMSDKEANQLEIIINEGCEQIHPNDWK